MNDRHAPGGLLEADVTKQIKDFMRWRGWRPVRFQRTIVPGQFQTGEPGVPDFQFIRYLHTGFPGLAVLCWVEMKRATRGRLQEHQIAWRDREHALGAIVLKASNIKDFEAEYERLFGWLQTEEWVRGDQREMRFEAVL